ncbi:MAG TPA: hypothetical protein VFV50_03430, partial [Bdellovibrionales bacterium]|nr:hypothetical protein [Bdellovibrionales bacterium]
AHFIGGEGKIRQMMKIDGRESDGMAYQKWVAELFSKAEDFHRDSGRMKRFRALMIPSTYPVGVPAEGAWELLFVYIQIIVQNDYFLRI